MKMPLEDRRPRLPIAKLEDQLSRIQKIKKGCRRDWLRGFKLLDIIAWSKFLDRAVWALSISAETSGIKN